VNEFLARKIGEVVAFCREGAFLFEQGEQALSSVLPEVATLRKELATHEKELLARTGELQSISEKKAHATQEKLSSMRDLYLADEQAWRDPAELLEWLGFFEGAALVHWSLIQGGASSDVALPSLAERGIEFHRKLLEDVTSAIGEFAKSQIRS
jgi:hypothetical protein